MLFLDTGIRWDQEDSQKPKDMRLIVYRSIAAVFKSSEYHPTVYLFWNDHWKPNPVARDMAVKDYRGRNILVDWQSQ